jgi:methyl-accepting chemotaxis protein
MKIKRKYIPMPKCFSTLRFKLILGFSIPIAFIILLGVVSSNMASSGIGNKYKDTATQVIGMTGNYIGFGIEAVESTSLEYINDKNITKYISGSYKAERNEATKAKSTIQNDLMVKTTVDDFILNIHIVSDDDNSLTSKSGLIIENDIYQKFMDTDTGKQIKGSKSKPMWFGGEALLDEKLSTKDTDYAMRLIQRYPNNKAFAVIDIKADKIKKILEDTKLDESGILAFVTKDGKEIAQNNNEEILFGEQTFYFKAMGGEETQGSEYVKINNKTYLFMYSKIGKTGALICALIPKDTIISQADNIKRVTFIIVIAACIIAVLIGVFISTGIDKTITGIIFKLKKAAQGDLTVEFHTNRNDEFKVLIVEIQNTISNMKNLIGQVNLLSEVVSDSSMGVNDTSALFLKSTEDISYAIKEIEQGIMQQAKDAEECLMQMDNLSKKIGMVSDNTKEISHITDNAKQSITEGTCRTQELNQQTMSTIIITTDIVNAIETLAQKSKSITQITNAINEIANQTNLLSLNASIEAARAGEYGKGFAVVADEIRNLAEQSQTSVKEIQKIINSIQNDTKIAVEAAKRAESALGLQESAVKNTIESYDNINDTVGELMVHLGYISENVESMEGSRASTLGAIENISAVLEEIAASSGTVNQNATEQINSVGALNQSAGILSKNAEELSQAIQKFTV